MKFNATQRIAVISALVLVVGLYFIFPIAKPGKQKANKPEASATEPPLLTGYSTDSVLAMSKSRLTSSQLEKVKQLE
jgi:hypothetical protein